MTLQLMITNIGYSISHANMHYTSKHMSYHQSLTQYTREAINRAIHSRLNDPIPRQLVNNPTAYMSAELNLYYSSSDGCLPNNTQVYLKRYISATAAHDENLWVSAANLKLPYSTDVQYGLNLLVWVYGVTLNYHII